MARVVSEMSHSEDLFMERKNEESGFFTGKEGNRNGQVSLLIGMPSTIRGLLVIMESPLQARRS